MSSIHHWKRNSFFVTDVFEEPINRLPLVITEGAMELEKNQIQFKGSILEQGDFETEEVGFIFQLNNKTLAYKAVLEPKKSSFTLVSSGLESGINHYFQAYAKTSFGVAYGSIRKFLIMTRVKRMYGGQNSQIPCRRLANQFLDGIDDAT